MHGVHLCCLVSERERVNARACCGTGQPFWCPWHAMSVDPTQRACVAYHSCVSGPSLLLQHWEETSRVIDSPASAMLPAGTEVYVRQDNGHLRRGVVREPGATKDAEPGSARSHSAKCPVDAEVLYVDGGRGASASPRVRIFGERAHEVRVPF